MNLDWITLLNSLGRSPGDLVYHLVLGSALLGLMIVTAQGKPGTPRHKAQRHILTGASLLFSFQVFLMILSLARNLSNQLPPNAIELIESMVHLLTLVWVIWALNERNETFLLTGGALFTSLALVLWGGISLGLLLLKPNFLPADDSWMLAVWDLGGITLAALGCLVLWVKRPQGWGVGTAVLLVLGLGHGMQLLMTHPESVRPGAVRLAEILALPWIWALLQRVCPSKPKASPQTEVDQGGDSKPALIEELLKLSRLEDEGEKKLAVARALSLSLIADMCYLVRFDSQGNGLSLIAGYDLIREQTLPTARLTREDLPNILKAWEDSQPYHPNYPPFTTRDAAVLTEIFNFHHIGHVLAYPLEKEDAGLQGGVIFLSPYTEKAFGQSALNLMAQIEKPLRQVLFESGPVDKLNTELAGVRQKASQAQEEVEALSQALADTQKTISQQEAEIRQLKAKYQIDKIKMVKEIDTCQEQIIHLSAQAASYKQNKARQEELNSRIRELIREKEEVARKLSQATTRVAELESQRQAESAASELQNEVLSLDAIAANVELTYGPRCQRREIRLDITNPDDGQLIKTDPGQLQRLIHNLLENALLACKPGGALQFRMELSFETGMLQIQVTDSGEGLTTEEQRAMFGEMAEPPAGIGNLQALREAVRRVQSLHGKIWLRSKPGSFTTFRVQLPVRILD